MRKLALVFVLAVLAPSLVLAWLAVRSVRDQQFLLERQQSLLYQGATDAIAQNISQRLSQQQQDFSAAVENLAASNAPGLIASQFDSQIRKSWPLTDVGFSVILSGPATCTLACPLPTAGPAAQRFLVDNGGFLGNSETAEVYLNNYNSKAPSQKNTLVGDNGFGTNGYNNNNSQGQQWAQKSEPVPQQANAEPIGQNAQNKGKARSVIPQGANYQTTANQTDLADNNLSKVIPAEAEFRQLIGDGTDGTLARFLQNKLKIMFWHRLNRDPNYVFGAQLNLQRLVADLHDMVQPDSALTNEICVAILDDNAHPVAISRPGFHTVWKRP